MNDKHIINELRANFPNGKLLLSDWQGQYPYSLNNSSCTFRYSYGREEWSASIDFEDSDHGNCPIYIGVGTTPREALSAMVESIRRELHGFERALEGK